MVIALCDVVKDTSRRGIEQGVNEPSRWFAQLGQSLIDPCYQSSPQRRDRARATKDTLFPAHQPHLITRARISVARYIRYTAPNFFLWRFGNLRVGLIRRSGKEIADSTTCSSIALVPDYLTTDSCA